MSKSITPIVEDVTEVEPIEEWAPAPGLGSEPVGAGGMSSLEDIQRFIDRSRRSARHMEAEIASQAAAHPASVEQPSSAGDSVDNDLSGDDFDDQQPTEQAEFNVPMIAQWWTRKS